MSSRTIDSYSLVSNAGQENRDTLWENRCNHVRYCSLIRLEELSFHEDMICSEDKYIAHGGVTCKLVSSPIRRVSREIIEEVTRK